MGIRIHKAIGYGLNDLDGLEDSRLTSDWIDKVYESDIDNFKRFLKDKERCIKILVDLFGMKKDIAKLKYHQIELALKFMAKRDRSLFPSDFVDFDGEANDNWILFYPAENIVWDKGNSWKRFDDTIDYYENRVYKKELDSIIIDLSEYGTLGIYPYNHGMHLKPGKKNKLGKYNNMFDKNKENYIEGGTYNMLVGDWDSNSKPLADEETIEHLRNDWHISIPVTTKLFVYYFNIFTKLDTIYDLKPLLCQWWG